MPFTIACSNCDARFQAPDTVAGKRVKCRKCGETFVARPVDEDEDDRPNRSAAKAAAKPRPRPVGGDEDEDDRPRRAARSSRRDDEDDSGDNDRPRQRRRYEDEDEPRPRKKTGKKKKAAGPPVLLFVLIGVGALLLIGGGVGAYLYFSDNKTSDDAAAKGGGPANPPPGSVGRGGAGLAAAGTWVEHVDAAGKYRIKFPRQPMLQTQTINEGGVQQTIKAMIAQSGQEAFVTNAIELPDPNVDPEVLLNTAEEQAAGRVRGGATVTNKRQLTHAGVKGREITLSIQGGTLTGIVRVFVTNGRIYTIGAVGPGYQATTTNVVTFFESLKFE